MLIFLPSCLFLLLISLVFINFFYKFWCTPIRIQSKMRSQGINGPSYKFIHGNTKEIIKIKSEMAPRELSHNVFPMLLPHFHTWIKLYGSIYYICSLTYSYCCCRRCPRLLNHYNFSSCRKELSLLAWCKASISSY